MPNASPEPTPETAAEGDCTCRACVPAPPEPEAQLLDAVYLERIQRELEAGDPDPTRADGSRYRTMALHLAREVQRLRIGLRHLAGREDLEVEVVSGHYEPLERSAIGANRVLHGYPTRRQRGGS